MNDLELAVSTFLPDVWQPGQRCNEYLGKYGDDDPWECVVGHQFPRPAGPWRETILYEHDIPCPPLTHDLAMRLLEAMLRKGIRVRFLSAIGRTTPTLFGVTPGLELAEWDSDLVMAITKAAAVLARKEEEKK